MRTRLRRWIQLCLGLVLLVGLGLGPLHAARLRVKPKVKPKVKADLGAAAKLVKPPRSRVKRPSYKPKPKPKAVQPSSKVDIPSKEALQARGLTETQADRVIRKQTQKAEKLGRLEAKEAAAGKPAPYQPKKGEKLVELDPKDIAFSQSSINKRFDVPGGKAPMSQVVRQGPDQVADFPPIRVSKVKGQWVARDGNSRLFVGKKTKAQKIKAIDETGDVPSWNDLNRRLKQNGLGPQGTKKLPTPR